MSSGDEREAGNRPRTALATVRLLLASVIFGVSTLTVVEVPHDVLWKPAIAATEAGHYLVLLAVVLAVGRLRLRRSRLATGLAASAVILFLSPTVQAWWMADDVSSSLDGLGAPASSRTPFSLVSLYAGQPDPVEPQVLTYAPGLQLDLYLHGRADAPRPIVLLIHGGSWRGGDRRQIPGIAHHLARQGYAVAALDYRKAPEHPFPAAPEDVDRAVVFLTNEADRLGLDTNRLVLLGRSAGGHLALHAAYNRRHDNVVGVVALYPPADLRWSWENPCNPWVLDTHDNLTAFLGGGPEDWPRVYSRASPYDMVRRGVPPTLLLHGTRDELVPIEQSRRLVAKLRSADVDHVLVEMGWATHGFDANLRGPGGQLYLYAVERFLHHVTPVH